MRQEADYMTRFGRVTVVFDDWTDGYKVYYGGKLAGTLTHEEWVRGYQTDVLERFIGKYLHRKESNDQHRQAQEREREEAADEAGSQGAGEGASEGEEGSGEGLGERVAGWRGWKVGENASLTPMSMNTDMHWSLDGLNFAHCHRQENPHGHYSWHRQIPEEECGCGFWAYRSYELMTDHGPRLDVHGVVSLGGRLQEHKLGIRAEAARIVALLESDEAQRLKNYWEWEHVREGKLFPIPILPYLECEMLAIEQGCVFEPDDPGPPPLPPNAQVLGQYIVIKECRAPYGMETEVRATFEFMPPDPTIVPVGAVRVDNYIAENGRAKVAVYDGWEKFTTYDLVKTRMRSSDGGVLEMWAFADGNFDRDIAMGQAIERYGSEWLRGYEV